MDELEISQQKLHYRGDIELNVQCVKTLQRNCIGGPVEERFKYFNDLLIDACIKLELVDLEVGHASKCKILYPCTYRAAIYGITNADYDPEQRYLTNLKDMFIKTYIILPINWKLHWSLCIICHPLYYLIKRYENVYTETEKVAFKNILDSKHRSCILFLDSLPGFHDHEKIYQEVTLYLSRLWIHYTERHMHNTFEGDLTDCISSDQYQIFVQWMREEYSLHKDDSTYNCFEKIESIDNSLGLRQDNGFDCGYYVVMNAAAFLRRSATTSLQQIIEFGCFDNWFSYDEVVYKKRGILGRFLTDLPDALPKEDIAHLPNIRIYLHSKYDVFKDANAKAMKTVSIDRVPEEEEDVSPELVKNIKLFLAQKRAYEMAFEALCKGIREQYKSKRRCENNKAAIQYAVSEFYKMEAMDVEDSHLAMCVLEMVNKSFPAVNNDRDNKGEHLDDEEYFMTQSSSQFLSQSSVGSSESVYTPSTQDTVVDNQKPKTRNKQQSKSKCETIITARTTRSKTNKDLNQLPIFSDYTAEFISQHTKPLFTLFYPSEVNTESGFLRSNISTSPSGSGTSATEEVIAMVFESTEQSGSGTKATAAAAAATIATACASTTSSGCDTKATAAAAAAAAAAAIIETACASTT